MKILVTGGNGQIATAISHYFPKHWRTTLLSHTMLDIGNHQAIKSVIAEFLPDVIINTAAFTAVDEAEKNPTAAFYANHEAVASLAALCEQAAIPLIHFSTDYIFDGNQSSPYQETDIPNPLNIYGLSKWKGEEAIRNLCQAHIILRVSSVFSSHGRNFVKTILELAKQKETLTIVADQIHCPTSANSIAVALHKIIENLSEKNFGTYHYCNSPPTTWYEFGKKIISIANPYQSLKVKDIRPITSASYAQQSNFPARRESREPPERTERYVRMANDFHNNAGNSSAKRIAARPHYSVLNCDKISRFFNLTELNWLEELERVIEKLGCDASENGVVA